MIEDEFQIISDEDEKVSFVESFQNEKEDEKLIMNDWFNYLYILIFKIINYIRSFYR